MPSFTSPVDSATLFYRYYKPDGIAFRPQDRETSDITLVFLHGWPMSSRMFEHLLVPLCETYRFPCVAPDRRGFGKSDWNTATTSSIGYDTFVADLVGLLEHLDVKSFVLLGASMGTQESVLAYLKSRSIQERCKGFVWMGPNMPFPVQSPEHPLGPPKELWDAIQDGLRADRAKYVSESLPGIFAVQAGNEVSTKTLEQYERIVDEADAVALDKTTRILQKDMSKELQEVAALGRVPIMILHGDSDQGSPLEASSQIVKDMLPWADLKVYEKGGHGLYLTHAPQVIADIVGFVETISGGQK